MPVNRPVLLAGLSQDVTTQPGLSPSASTRIPAARARSARVRRLGSWLDVVTFGGTATNNWSMPVLTAKSTVATGVLVSHTHRARESGVEAVAAVPVMVVALGCGAAAELGARARAAAAKPARARSGLASRRWRGRVLRAARRMR